RSPPCPSASPDGRNWPAERHPWPARELRWPSRWSGGRAGSSYRVRTQGRQRRAHRKPRSRRRIV
ncbi:hypothetical protein DFQ30_001324, partial [Apophysomyces sp. BC1015]